MRKCLQIALFSHLEKREESVWLSNRRTLKVSGSFPGGKPRKSWSDAIRNDLKERKVSKGLAKYKNALKSFVRNREPM